MRSLRKPVWLIAAMLAALCVCAVLFIRKPELAGPFPDLLAPSPSPDRAAELMDKEEVSPETREIDESKRHALDEVRKGQRITLERDIAARQALIEEKRKALSELVRNQASPAPNPPSTGSTTGKPDFLQVKQELDAEVKALERLEAKLGDL